METIKKGFEALLPIITAGLLALVAKFILQWIGELTDKLLRWVTDFGDHLNKLKYLRDMEADDFILDKVSCAIQGVKDSYVDSIKNGGADGKLTKEEAQEANRLAWEAFRESLSEIELKTVVGILGEDFKKIIIARIPGIVAGLKIGNWFSKDEPPAAEVPEEIVKELLQAKEEAEKVNPS